MLQVISASRRTDLPRCFPDQLSAWLQAGQVIVKNPFNALERLVDIRPANVHTLVLWSKDFSLLLKNHNGLREQLQAYSQLYFHFTVTGLGSSRFEPGVLAWEQATLQFSSLVELAGDPWRVNWRFDPIVFWKEGRSLRSNLRYFDRIADQAVAAGLRQVTISLCQWYLKSRRRAAQHDIAWTIAKAARIKNLATWLQARARERSLEIRACCTPEFTPWGILPARCIDGELLTKLHPQQAPAEQHKDSGQRPACGCTLSIDIGSYQLACPQGCIYCYAHPTSSSAAENQKRLEQIKPCGKSV